MGTSCLVQGTGRDSNHVCCCKKGPHPAQEGGGSPFNVVTDVHLEERGQDEPYTFHVIKVSQSISLQMYKNNNSILYCDS